MKIKKSTKIQGKELTKKVLKYSIGERERERVPDEGDDG
jgi:hypothetical protein